MRLWKVFRSVPISFHSTDLVVFLGGHGVGRTHMLFDCIFIAFLIDKIRYCVDGMNICTNKMVFVMYS